MTRTATTTDSGRDVRSGETDIVSLDSTGAVSGGQVLANAVSDDGRYVSMATVESMVPADPDDDSLDLYVRDRELDQTLWATVSGGESTGTGSSTTLSGDGRHVVFAAPVNNIWEVMVRSREVP